MDLQTIYPVTELMIGKRYIVCYKPNVWPKIRMMVRLKSYDELTYGADIVSGDEKYRYKDITFSRNDVLLYDIFPHTFCKPDKLMSLSQLAFWNLPTLDIHYKNANLCLL